VRYLRPPIEADQRNAAVSHIIFPRYSATGPTELKPVGRCEALRRLMEECLALRQRLDQDNVEQLVRWIAAIGCFTLNYSSLDEAAELIWQAVHR